LDYGALAGAVAQDAALRRRQRLQPVGRMGDKIFPPTYPEERRGTGPRHVFERRTIDGAEIWCVLIDSVQSQANRLEEALLAAVREGAMPLPYVTVDFTGKELAGISEITSLDAPHRVYDAILRDSLHDGQPFMKSPLGLRLAEAKPGDATALLEASPTALLFGAWHSTGEGGGFGAKFPRCLVSEIVAVNTPVDEIADQRTGEIEPRTSGRRTGSRIDPLGVLRKVEVFKGSDGWDVVKDRAGRNAKLVRPSEINHGNIAPSVQPLGVTCDYAEHVAVISFAGLRRQDRPVNAKQIGRELGVRYVLEGSVRRSDKQVRVNAQLIDAETDAHLWAEWFERDTTDLFALQNEITSRIAIALNFALIGAEAAHPTANPDALDYVFRARAVMSKPPTRDGAAEAIGLLEHALTLDPASAEAQMRLAGALTGRVLLEMGNTRDADLARAEGLLGQVSPDFPGAHWKKGHLLRAQGRIAEAIPEYEATIALDRNAAGAYANLGHAKLLAGSIEELIPLVEQAIRLSPRDPDLGYWYDLIGRVHLLQSHTGEAIAWLEKARSASLARPFIRAHLAAAYGLKGDSKRAATELAEARRLSGDPDQYSSVAGLSRENFAVPKIRALWEATFFVGLRNAGLSEE
jgi:CRISPR-associated protein Csb1